MKQKKAVIFIGPPGAGKGTQAALLEKRFGFYHIESSDLIEDKFKSTQPGDPDYEEVERQKKLFKEGILTDPSFITKLMVEAFRKSSERGDSIVLSGSPRTLPEAKDELPILLKEYGKENIFFIHMPIPARVSIERNSKRRICKEKRHPIPYTEETKDWTICPEDGSPLIDRGVLDDPETIKVRLEEYKNRTEPILDLAAKEFNLSAHFVDGEKPIEERFELIKEIVGLNDN